MALISVQLEGAQLEEAMYLSGRPSQDQELVVSFAGNVDEFQISMEKLNWARSLTAKHLRCVDSLETGISLG